MKTFYKILVNALISSVTTNFVWFALTYWAYLETKSVLTTSIVSGVYLTATALSGFWLGSIVDHNTKKTAMMISSIATLILFSLGFILLLILPESSFITIANPALWVLILLLLLGVIAGNIRTIALPTLVTLLVPTEERDKANGLSGTMMGISFAITSVASGILLAYTGMVGVLTISIIFTFITMIHLGLMTIVEKKSIKTSEIAVEPNQENEAKSIDIRGTIRVIAAVPGLFALIFFNTLNNFLGGVFMSLMDAYGLTLVSVQVWGILFGFLSMGFIIGGLLISKKGLGTNPVKTLFLANLTMWVISIFFTIQPSIVLLALGIFFWICLVPYVEAAEQTIIQKVVPAERQGRVFGFSQSVEQTASPLTAFFIGPIAQFIFIPFMTTGAGVNLIGGWYGVGPGRGMGLVFTVTGIIGFIITMIAMRSKSYRLLSKSYQAESVGATAS